MRTIDTHAHITPRVLLEAKAAGTDLHGIDPQSIARGQLRSISPETRLAEMQATAVDFQVVSAEPQVYCYQHDAASVAALHRECNDEVHELAVGDPGHFAGLAILPMQDLSLAIQELERVMGLGLKGAMIGDHVNGAYYDEPQFLPFWKAAEATGAVVLMHQASPTIVSSRIKRYHLSNTVGNPVERTLDFAALVFGGIMDKFPDLKVILGHGGGYATFAAGRMDWGWQWRKEARANISQPPSTYLDRFFYDCITHSELALRFVIDSAGIDKVVFGTDYPGYAAGKEGAGYQPREWLMGLKSLTDAEKDAILGGNAERLFGI